MTQPWPQPPDTPPPGLPEWWPDEDPGPGRLRAWLAADPGHGFAAGVPGLWLLGETLHTTGCTYQWGAAGTVGAAAVTAAAAQWIAARPVPDWADPPETIGAVEAGTGVLVAGGWVTAAAVYGPAAPHGTWLLSAALAGLAGAAWYGWLRSHDAVQAARARRADKRTWDERKAFWDDLTRRVDELDGCDLIDHIATLTGEQVCLDTRGTGKLATGIRTRAVEERIGELWHPRIPRGRIDCWLDEFPGRIWISVRSRDPWKFPVVHPALDPRSIAAKYLEGTPTARRPLVLGLDPEDGEPFGLVTGPGYAGLPVWVPDQGGQVILVVGTKGGGKTNTINVLTERGTACPDMRVLQVNLTKPAEMRAWSPACPANALGRHQLGRARAILAWVERYIDDYGDTAADAIATPSEASPHLMVIVDEVADVADDGVCKARLIGIARKCRSAGVTLVIAGQRATAKWLGGADLRAMIDVVLVGRFARREEMDKAVGAHLDLPDFAAYGKGAAGVFMMVELAGGDYDRGRTLKLKEPRDCRRIAAARSWLADWTPANMAEDQAWLWNVITTWDDVPLDAWRGQPGAMGGDDEDSQAREPDELPAPHLPAPAGQAPGVPGVAAADMRVIWPMLARAEGVSAGEAGKRLGKHRDTARKYLTAVCAAGHARVQGDGRDRRYYVDDRPPLAVITGGDTEDEATLRDHQPTAEPPPISAFIRCRFGGNRQSARQWNRQSARQCPAPAALTRSDEPGG